PRLKIGQKYCGKKSCQQSRKNSWERAQLRKDPFYHQRRYEQKSRWRKNRPAHQYQRSYRENHADYVKVNQEKQYLRNKNIQKQHSGDCFPNIVKTDALISEKLVRCGLYEILPYKMSPGKKIVKTDALIVELLAHRGFQKVLVSDSG
ncbi:MAG: hypothetical protein K0B09_15090, partial [Bacteroidales bacterium]|nr:hypothetical protein [Bacteroidales bacterium]